MYKAESQVIFDNILNAPEHLEGNGNIDIPTSSSLRGYVDKIITVSFDARKLTNSIDTITIAPHGGKGISIADMASITPGTDLQRYSFISKVAAYDEIGFGEGIMRFSANGEFIIEKIKIELGEIATPYFEEKEELNTMPMTPSSIVIKKQVVGESGLRGPEQLAYGELAMGNDGSLFVGSEKGTESLVQVMANHFYPIGTVLEMERNPMELYPKMLWSKVKGFVNKWIREDGRARVEVDDLPPFYFSTEEEAKEYISEHKATMTSIKIVSLEPILKSCNNLFFEAKQLEYADFSDCNMNEVTDLAGMFRVIHHRKPINIDFGKNTFPKVINTSAMFYHNTSEMEVNMPYFNPTGKVSCSLMFGESTGIKKIDLRNWDIKDGTDLSLMFLNTMGLTEAIARTGLDADKLNNSSDKHVNSANFIATQQPYVKVSIDDLPDFYCGGNDTFKEYLQANKTTMVNVVVESEQPVLTNITGVFWGASVMSSIDVSKLNTSNVKYMRDTFRQCVELKNLDLSSFDTSNVLDMVYLVGDCRKLETVNLSGWDTSKNTNFGAMFLRCFELRNIDVSSFDTSKGTSTSHMFGHCYHLTVLDLSSFDTSSMVNTDFMFSGDNAVTVAYARTQEDCDKLNASDGKPTTWNFVVKPQPNQEPILQRFAAICTREVQSDTKNIAYEEVEIPFYTTEGIKNFVENNNLIELIIEDKETNSIMEYEDFLLAKEV